MKSWLPVIGLAVAAFIFNTSEFMPIGLLSSIANDFSITESQAGMMITVYAWVVAMASLPLMLVFAKTEYKKLMLWLVAIFTLSHALSGIATNFNFLMISRLGIACVHAIFWSIVAPLAVLVAPQGKGDTAIGIVSTGSSIAMILGLPLGRAIGLVAGWRMTFLIVGATAAAVFVLLSIVLKKTPSDSNFSLRKLPALLKTPALLGVYLLTVFFITGHFTAYSYIEPFLAQVAGLGENLITVTLSLFGVVGIVGSVIFAKRFNKGVRPFFIAAVFGPSLMMLALHVASFHPAAVIAACLVWGLTMNFYNLSFQSEIIRIAPQGTSVAMSIYSGIYNVGIGTGALVGGYVFSDVGISAVGYVGGSICLCIALWCVFKLLPQLLRR